VIPLPPAFRVRFVLSLGLVIFLSNAYEVVREKHLLAAEEKQRLLEEEGVKLAAAKEAADQASAAKSMFLANMSHELRTPLNAVMGFTELLVDRSVGEINAVQEEYLKDILDSARHLLLLINDVLDLSKLDTGEMAVEIWEVDVKGLLQSGLGMVRERALSRGIALELVSDGVPEVVRADGRQLKQVLFNLLSNAVKFTPNGGQVCLSAEVVRGEDGGWLRESGEAVEVPLTVSGQGSRRGDWLMVTVADTGVGIGRGDLHRVFEPFEQADNSASRRHQGAGLGLSLARRMVELNGGTIWAESAGTGRGSAVSFVIPVEGPGLPRP
jgi:signal transduction histidine kinase